MSTTPAPAPGLDDLSFRSVVRIGLPGLARQGLLPLLAFYLGDRFGSLAIGIAASAIVVAIVYAAERRSGNDVLIVRLALLFVVVQSIAALLSGSATVYLAGPVVGDAIWAVAFFVSVAIRRPLMGALACAWYPFTPEVRASEAFLRIYSFESIVWGVYMVVRGAIQLVVLLEGSTGEFVLMAFLVRLPSLLALIAWSIWYSLRRFAAEEQTAS